ncbi:anthranilate synthase component I [Candidatus Epulonipiscium viviparus]|uniref:anthranilate synthase component I n=1 Tax=Candidatus Epulonipiscium viviparus TaxID=420336 RepID=UPI0004955951|nr:anthranilate synthase component I [Candidatus Epulopiscium viviparus]
MIELSKYKDEYKMFPLSAEILADTTTPINILRKLNEISDNFYLLESVENSESLGRYSFLGFEPSLNIKYKNGITTITSSEIISTSTEDPITILRKYINKYKSPKLPELPPFTGGFIGYMAYEMIAYAEPKLTLPLNHDNDFEFQFFDKVIAFDNLKKKIIVIVNMKLDNIAKQYKKARLEIAKIISLIQSTEAPEKIPYPKTVSFNCTTSKTKFFDMVKRAKQYITDGDIFQVVLSRKFEADFSGSLIDAYRMLRVNNPSPYMYFIKSDALEICGTSPETLVKVVDRKITTFPVAGTRPRGKTPEEDAELERSLLADEKELAEHNMLVDLARNDIGRVAAFGTVEVEEYLQIHRYSKVMHIASIVSGTLKKSFDAFHAINSLLPAGTLSGAPKFRACEIIAELEECSRGIYGGAIGYIDLSGNLDMCIAIRTAISDGQKVYVQAGAGIVYDSIAHNEYQECRNKASAVMQAVENAYNIDQF